MAVQKKRIIIIGAGEAGRLLAEDINKATDSQVIGFFDDEHQGEGILGKIADTAQMAAQGQVDEILIAIPSADGDTIRRVLMANVGNTVPIRIVPRSSEILKEGRVRYARVKSIEVEDFLGRPLHKKDLDYLGKRYAGKKVMVTGGAGSIGSEIVRQLINLDAKEVVVYDNSEFLCWELDRRLKAADSRGNYQIIIGDVLDGAKVERVIKEVRPDLVIHAAAYKHVDLMECHPDEALKVNLLGTMNVVKAVRAAGLNKMVFISTDKVVNPRSVMGATKKLAEEYVVSQTDRNWQGCAVRFGNVINSNGSVLPLFELQIREGKYVTLTDPAMERFFMSIREAAELVLMSGAGGQQGKIYVLDMGDLISIKEVAMCLIRSKNLRPGEDIELKVVGIRPGEKLKEELFDEEELLDLGDAATPYIKTVQSRSTVPNIGLIARDLEALAKTGKTEEIKKMLKQVFPSLGSGANNAEERERLSAKQQ